MEGKDIYILLVHALLRWRRPARPVDDAQLVTPCWADTGTRPIFQQIESMEEWQPIYTEVGGVLAGMPS
jgi:hypothetical protein